MICRLAAPFASCLAPAIRLMPVAIVPDVPINPAQWCELARRQEHAANYALCFTVRSRPATIRRLSEPQGKAGAVPTARTRWCFTKRGRAIPLLLNVGRREIRR